MSRRSRRLNAGALRAVLLLSLSGCAVPVATGLSESDANRSVVALGENGVSAQKAPDAVAEGRWQISVPRSDTGLAAMVLTRESLPPLESTGVLEALGDASLVPSRLAEHARLVAGTAGDLEQSLRAVDGIVSARVHLAVPETDPLSPEAQKQASASVLLRHRGASAPLSENDVQALVAGAVAGLSREQVRVVLARLPFAPEDSANGFASFGPFVVSRASLGALKLLAFGAIALNLVLLGAVLALWVELRRLRTERGTRGPPHGADA